MLYTMISALFDLPSSNGEQVSCNIYESKRELLLAVAEQLEDNREPITELGCDDAEEELEAALDELAELSEREDIESLILEEMSWEAGDFTISIIMCKPFPDCIDSFEAALKNIGEDIDYDDLITVEEAMEEFGDLYDEDHDETVLLERLHEGITEAEFKEVFLKANDLWDGSMF